LSGNLTGSRPRRLPGSAYGQQNGREVLST
jgi:hypothetical protein